MTETQGTSRAATESPSENKRWLNRILIWGVCGVGVTAAIVLLLVPYFLMPAEDATILFQFSRNLAHTGAITYIPYGPHAEGATDFAWMVLLSAAIKLGFEPFAVVGVFNFGSLFLFGYLIVRLAVHRASWASVAFVMGTFALLPQFWSAASGFSTLPFACLLLLLICATLETMDAGAPLLALLLCLFRPDGVVFAIPLLAAGVICFPGKWRRFSLDVGVFVLPGIGYFLWRWHYFGELLPLPFLVKADAVRLGHYLVVGSLKEARNLLLFTLVILFAALRGRMNDVKNRIVLVCVIVLPTIFYLGMRLDQDVGCRFFIYLPVGVAVLVARNWESFGVRQGWVLRVGLAAWLLCLFTLSFKEGHRMKSFQLANRRAVSVSLASLRHGTMLATEAGIVPYYSGWATYDSWGLNTAEFARHMLQPDDVLRLNADLVMLHSGKPPVCEVRPDWQVPHKVRTWDNMIQNLVAGIDISRYELFYVPRAEPVRLDGSTRLANEDLDCWYVRKDSAMRSGVEEDLLQHNGISQAQYQALLADEAKSENGLGAGKLASKPTVLSRITDLWHKIA